MDNRNKNDDRYYKAKERVDEIKGFYGNLISYVVSITVLMIINLLTSPSYLWFFWPMLGWGLGILIHGAKVFNLLPFFGKKWEEQKIKEFMEKEKQHE
ncbi:hypothetical protein HNQ02_001153 [Flavobacterium sp. 7E]|uniref:2TM domain-containing protein n=1 Tax=unclassified Flavobacterium TaxID=196869 RepID=UPI0015703987|nr:MULTISPECIES: 2TM domain-containing protein [unclassified Flavobacterium]MBE0390496.1 hypothetical protein [Flavobacterium sp. PL002]NRS88239.1 hypothetical protein [Flavobacterium sp. 7E]